MRVRRDTAIHSTARYGYSVDNFLQNNLKDVFISQISFERIVIKLLAPFFVHHIKYSFRVVIVVIVNMASFLLVALVPTEYKWLIFVGVMFASLSASFGEITFLSLSTLYDRRLSLTGWGSGTGAAGQLILENASLVSSPSFYLFSGALQV